MRAFQIYGRTEVGPIRKINEDHILIGRYIKNLGGLGIYLNHSDDYLANYGMVLAVADGIGGEAGGMLASKLVLTAFERQFYGSEKLMQPVETYIDCLQASAERANETLLSLAASKPELSGMGCTISGICITQSGYLVFNAGDSRVYRYRNGILKPLTNDDSVTSLAIQAGQLSFEEAKKADTRHTLTNCLGSESFQIKIQQGPEFRDYDTILICSDGLHDLVEHDQIEKLLAANSSVEELAAILIEQAFANGGNDNISVILVRSDIFESRVGWHQPLDKMTESNTETVALPISPNNEAAGQSIVPTITNTSSDQVPQEQKSSSKPEDNSSINIHKEFSNDREHTT